MEDLTMIPGSPDTGHDDAMLTWWRMVTRDVISRSASGTTVLFASIRRVLGVLSEWQKRAAGRYTLASLDDYLLRDVGLTRADVERELVKPFWRP
jgi:uncharacterized protein YjiS (DUF1127 family)